jgi:hypothetical protein
MEHHLILRLPLMRRMKLISFAGGLGVEDQDNP